MLGNVPIGNYGLEIVGFLCDKIGLSPFLVSPEMGAKTALYCALEPSLADSQYSGRSSIISEKKTRFFKLILLCFTLYFLPTFFRFSLLLCFFLLLYTTS